MVFFLLSDGWIKRQGDGKAVGYIGPWKIHFMESISLPVEFLYMNRVGPGPGHNTLFFQFDHQPIALLMEPINAVHLVFLKGFIGFLRFKKGAVGLITMVISPGKTRQL
mgnify:CR=1 FL=1